MLVAAEQSDERALLKEAIDACIRASGYAREQDGIWLTIAAALLRCDLFERLPRCGNMSTEMTVAPPPRRPQGCAAGGNADPEC